jgi:hypothetical protein
MIYIHMCVCVCVCVCVSLSLSLSLPLSLSISLSHSLSLSAVEHQILRLAEDGKLQEYKAEPFSLLALLVQKYLLYWYKSICGLRRTANFKNKRQRYSVYLLYCKKVLERMIYWCKITSNAYADVC